MAKKPQRVVQVIERKLGREKAWGIIHASSDGRKAVIEIDPRQKGEQELDTVVHEGLHFAFPILDEDAVKKGATDIAKILWTYGYRKVVQ